MGSKALDEQAFRVGVEGDVGEDAVVPIVGELVVRERAVVQAEALGEVRSTLRMLADIGLMEATAIAPIADTPRSRSSA